MLRLNITSQPIRLEFRQINAQLNLEAIPPQLGIETTSPRVEIQQPPGKLTIDQTPCRYSIGLKNMTDFSRDNAEFSRQSFRDNLSRIVAEGNRMAQIQNKSDAIAEIALDSTQPGPLDITWAHIDAPIIRYEASPARFNPIAGSVRYTLHRGSVQGDYLPGRVDLRVIQYPHLEISTVDVKV